MAERTEKFRELNTARKQVEREAAKVAVQSAAIMTRVQDATPMIAVRIAARRMVATMCPVKAKRRIRLARARPTTAQ
jgi:hypothetical protein